MHRSNAPHAQGTAEVGSNVTIHTANTCSSASQIGVENNTDGTYDITLTVAGDTLHTFYVKTTDPATNASACSAGVQYREDSIAPGVPAGKDLIRTAISAMHTEEQLEKIADAMAYAVKRL